jgi:hydrogenase expression/formation protein HypC
MQLVERDGLSGLAALYGVQRNVSLMLCPDAQLGEHVLVHAGFVISRVDEEEAKKTLSLIEQVMGGEVPP